MGGHRRRLHRGHRRSMSRRGSTHRSALSRSATGWWRSPSPLLLPAGRAETAQRRPDHDPHRGERCAAGWSDADLGDHRHLLVGPSPAVRAHRRCRSDHHVAELRVAFRDRGAAAADEPGHRQPPTPQVTGFYVGWMLLISLLQTAIFWHARRTPGLMDEGTKGPTKRGRRKFGVCWSPQSSP